MGKETIEMRTVFQKVVQGLVGANGAAIFATLGHCCQERIIQSPSNLSTSQDCQEHVLYT